MSRGANRAALVERADLRLDDLENPEGRIPLTTYIALIKAGIELCNEPALSLLFGEAVNLRDITIVGFLGETLSDVESGPAMMNVMRAWRWILMMMETETQLNWSTRVANSG